MEVLHGNDEELTEIIDKMESKYDLYNWATIKENDKEDEHYSLVDNSARKMEVELTGISDDDKEDQRLTLFAFRKSSKTEVDDAVGRITKVLLSLKKADLPRFERNDSGRKIDWYFSEQFRGQTLGKVQELLKRDGVIKSLIDSHRMTMIMFQNDSSIDLTGWHFKSNMEVLDFVYDGNNQIRERYLGFTMGFMFNFKEDTSSFTCTNGNPKSLAIDGSFKYCVCDMGYGGEKCDITLKVSPESTLSGSVLKMVEDYKVPGMFDLQDDIKKGTDAIMKEMENNKQEIFFEIKKAGQDIEKSKNSILSAQSIMLNELKAENAKVLQGLSGLQSAMEAAFESERNDRIYRTEEGQKVVIKAISDSNKEVTDSINRLTGKVIENRYFKELKLHIPVYQGKFERAISYGGFAEQDFSDYLKLHEQSFQAAKEAARKAIVEKTDSFVMAQMQISMVSGCTDEYTQKIKLTWAEMMELHLATTTMELWDLDYKIKTSTNEKEIEFLNHEKNELTKKTKSDTDEFKEVYKSRSCPEFSLPELVGGGCGPSITFPGQTVPMQCTDPNKSLVLKTDSQVITEVVCNAESSWAVNMTDLKCVTKCKEGDKYYDIGERKRLPAAPTGFYFADLEGKKVEDSTCLAPWDVPPSAKSREF